MAVITRNEISNYLTMYKDYNGVAFTKNVVSVLGLEIKEVYLRIFNEHYPCIIYKTAFTNAEIVINLDKHLLEKIIEKKEKVYLRFYFISQKKNAPIAFLVPSKITNWSLYNEKKNNLFFLNLSFLRTPPDDLIYLLGTLIDASQVKNFIPEEMNVLRSILIL